VLFFTMQFVFFIIFFENSNYVNATHF
jgi:hypothetical protein